VNRRLRRKVGAKAFYLEPWLICGSALLWLAVLPLASLLWSGREIARLAHLRAA
jgi:hypothetical protein